MTVDAVIAAYVAVPTPRQLAAARRELVQKRTANARKGRRIGARLRRRRMFP